MPTYTDILSDELHAAGWSYGYGKAMDKMTEEIFYVADAHKGDLRAKAHGETLQTALMELVGVTGRLDRQYT